MLVGPLREGEGGGKPLNNSEKILSTVFFYFFLFLNNKKKELKEVWKFPIEIFRNIGAKNLEIISKKIMETGTKKKKKKSNKMWY